jgi:hypothetical protein
MYPTATFIMEWKRKNVAVIHLIIDYSGSRLLVDYISGMVKPDIGSEFLYDWINLASVGKEFADN